MFTQISLIFPLSIRKMSIPLTSTLRVPCVPRMTQRVATLLPSGDESLEIRNALDDGRRIAKHDIGRDDRIDRGRAAFIEDLFKIASRDRLVVGSRRRLRARQGGNNAMISKAERAVRLTTAS